MCHCESELVQYNSSPSPDKIWTKLSNVRIKMPQFLIHFPQSTFKNVIFKINAVASAGEYTCTCMFVAVFMYVFISYNTQKKGGGGGE